MYQKKNETIELDLSKYGQLGDEISQVIKLYKNHDFDKEGIDEKEFISHLTSLLNNEKIEFVDKSLIVHVLITDLILF